QLVRHVLRLLRPDPVPQQQEDGACDVALTPSRPLRQPPLERLPERASVPPHAASSPCRFLLPAATARGTTFSRGPPRFHGPASRATRPRSAARSGRPGPL